LSSIDERVLRARFLEIVGRSGPGVRLVLSMSAECPIMVIHRRGRSVDVNPGSPNIATGICKRGV
jgi:hypothetical protein